MDLHVDIRWLLERQAEVLPGGELAVRDYSALVAAVARHRVKTPRLGEDADAAWCAGALLHTVVRLRPLPARNVLFGCGVAVAYVDATGQAVDPPYGELVDLARGIGGDTVDVFDTARRLRAWRI
ncbi:toxin Doc [Yinghuangia sp. YIM S09857]|uniref:toxin Doc n=1 Tax=Yinghuangia sp. YIM S09857 TaxID=3436929 RepID=UPI003F530CA3